MMEAARGGHLPVVQYLVEKGANIMEAKDKVNEQLNISILFVTLAWYCSKGGAY